MEMQRRMLLTQSVSFIQANLHPCQELLEALQEAQVLTTQEVKVIMDDETSSGKVVELVCLLKHKDNHSFQQFLQVLEQFDCNAVTSMFKTKQTMSESMLADPRTAAFLQEYLHEWSISPRTLQDLARRLVLMEVHQDEVCNLQDKLTALQRTRAVRSKTPSTWTLCTTPLPSSSPPKSPAPRASLDIPSLLEDKDSLLRQKDMIIHRKDEEYQKLKKILEDTQVDLQSILDLNTQYLAIISQMNSMQLQASTPREMPQPVSEQVIELEQKLEMTQAQLQELQQDLQSLNYELSKKEQEVNKLSSRERKYKKMLGLDENENDEYAIENQIQKLMKAGEMQIKDVEHIHQELKKILVSKSDLEDRVEALIREKEKVEFHMRQQDMTIKRMKRQKMAVETLHTAHRAMKAKFIGDNPAKLTLPAIERPGSTVSTRSSKELRANLQYCMFCRFEYQPLKNPLCRTHFRPIRSGKWSCCKDDCHRSAGCLQIPHFYIEVTYDRKIFLTDGARYLELT